MYFATYVCLYAYKYTIFPHIYIHMKCVLVKHCNSGAPSTNLLSKGNIVASARQTESQKHLTLIATSSSPCILLVASFAERKGSLTKTLFLKSGCPESCAMQSCSRKGWEYQVSAPLLPALRALSHP